MSLGKVPVVAKELEIPTLNKVDDLPLRNKKSHALASNKFGEPRPY